MRVVGLDISLASTGFADIEQFGGTGPGWGYLLKSNAIKTERAKTLKGKQPTLLEQHTRLQLIEDRVISMCLDFGPKPALVVVEATSPGSTGFMQVLIFGCWWRVTGRVLRSGLTVVEVSPSQVKEYATGSGSTRGKTKVTKEMVVAAVNDRYDVGAVRLRPSENDRADAIVLAAIGARLLGHPIDPHIPAANLRALTKIRLPEGITAS